jgi:hypothetical protein
VRRLGLNRGVIIAGYRERDRGIQRIKDQGVKGLESG